jgi:hypothetical protein
MPQIITYTAIIGSYDYLKDQPHGKYVAYLNPCFKNPKWETRQARLLFDSPTRNARMYKILSHQFIDSEWSLWVDGSITLLAPPEALLDKYGHNDITMFDSRDYHTIKQEADRIVTIGKDKAETVFPQYERYLKSGYVDDRLSTTGAILRHHTKQTEEFNNCWWSELCAHSHRDQLSVDYAAWKTGVEIAYFEGNVYHSPEFSLSAHL